MVPQPYRAVDVLERVAVLRQRLDAKEVAVAARRQDEVVVADFAALDLEAAPGRIYSAHSPQAELDVGIAVQDAPHRVGDLAWLQTGSGHLIQQRLEQMVVVLVDQQHIQRLAAELPGRVQPTKARADDDHLRPSGPNRQR